MWGKEFNFRHTINRKNKTGRPLQLENYFTPEGSRLVARCEECGGIHEALMDMRPNGMADLSPFIKATNYLSEVWVPQHEYCADKPRQWKIPEPVQEMIDKQLAQYKESFATEDDYSVLGHLAVLTKGGILFYMPFADIPYGDDRRAEAESRKFAIREKVREEGDSILYQLSFMEAWGVEIDRKEEHSDIEPRHHPFRKERIMVTVELPEFTKTGECSINRLNKKNERGPAISDDDFSGPAEIGEFKWATSGQGHLIEGILAANNRFTV